MQKARQQVSSNTPLFKANQFQMLKYFLVAVTTISFVKIYTYLTSTSSSYSHFQIHRTAVEQSFLPLIEKPNTTTPLVQKIVINQSSSVNETFLIRKSIIKAKVLEKKPIIFYHIGEKEVYAEIPRVPICDVRSKKFVNSTCIRHVGQKYDSSVRILRQNKELYQAFLITIRNPLQLFQWWYHNLPNYVHFSVTDINRCFPQKRGINYLVRVGLGDQNNTHLRRRICPTVAKYCFIGDMKPCRILHSYEVYTRELVELSNVKPIYIIRVNHFRDDIKKVQEIHSEFKGLKLKRLGNMTKEVKLAPDFVTQICFYLCKEFVIYKMLVERAQNLNSLDKIHALVQLNKTCPTEFHYHNYTECPAIPLPLPPLLEQSYNYTANPLLHSSLTHRKIAFIHIGKSAGTTAAKMIRRQCTLNSYRGCSKAVLLNEFRSIPSNETQISKQVQEYFHIRKPNITRYNSFIVTVRHPLDRLVSWYLHQYPANKLFITMHHLPLYECFKTIDDLATRGLRHKKYGNFKMQKCQQEATDWVVGRSKFYQHAQLNYEYYTSELLQAQQKEIFALRTEHFWDDWAHINKMLGEKNEIYKTPSFTHRKRNQTLAEFNRTISLEGISNMCFYLCQEIQIYKALINRAVNLNQQDRDITFQELNNTCPVQTASNTC